MSCLMLYGPGLRGYAPYARGLRSDLTQWIIQRITHKRKSANLFIIFGSMNEFLYHILPIIHVYNASISWLRSNARLRLEDATPVVCLTPVGRRDSVRMHDSDHMPDSSRKTRLRSYARLRLEDMILVVYPDSGHTSWLWSMSRLRSCLPTPVAHHSSGRWACNMSYQLIYERLRMVELDDCSIL
jgi:hypothetical protein